MRGELVDTNTEEEDDEGGTTINEKKRFGSSNQRIHDQPLPSSPSQLLSAVSSLSSEEPTQFPTYNTYFPTSAFPTYTPTLTESPTTATITPTTVAQWAEIPTNQQKKILRANEREKQQQHQQPQQEDQEEESTSTDEKKEKVEGQEDAPRFSTAATHTPAPYSDEEEEVPSETAVTNHPTNAITNGRMSRPSRFAGGERFPSSPSRASIPTPHPSFEESSSTGDYNRPNRGGSSSSSSSSSGSGPSRHSQSYSGGRVPSREYTPTRGEEIDDEVPTKKYNKAEEEATQSYSEGRVPSREYDEMPTKKYKKAEEEATTVAPTTTRMQQIEEERFGGLSSSSPTVMENAEVAATSTSAPIPSPERFSNPTSSSSSSSSSSGRTQPSRPTGDGRYNGRTPYPTREPEEERTRPTSSNGGGYGRQPSGRVPSRPSRPSSSGGREPPSRPSGPVPSSSADAEAERGSVAEVPTTKTPISRAPPTKAPTTFLPTYPPTSSAPAKREITGTEEITDLPTYHPTPSRVWTNDQTAKLNLSFPVNDPTPRPTKKKKETAKISLKFQVPSNFGKDEDDSTTPAGSTATRTEEPTYFLYPSYVPTSAPAASVATRVDVATFKPTKKDKRDKSKNKDKSQKKDKQQKGKEEDEDEQPTGRWGEPDVITTPAPTDWPTYSPIDQRPRPSKEFVNDRHQFKDPVRSPSSNNGGQNVRDDWSWAPTRNDDEGAPSANRASSGRDGVGNQQQQGASAGSDDAFSPIFEKRICPGHPFGVDPMSPKLEQEVLFAYGVQTAEGRNGRSIEAMVERMQLWMLEDVARHLLNCPDDSSSVDGVLSNEGDEESVQTVSRVYYMADESVATLSDCTPSVTNATYCAIVKSAIYLTANIGHEDEARAHALSVIHHRLRRGSYEEGTILHTSYLGPDLDALYGVRGNNSANEEGHSSSSSPPASYYIAIVVVCIAFSALGFFLVMRMRVRRARKRAASIIQAQSTQSPLPFSCLTSSRTSRGHDDTNSLLNETPRM